MTAIAGGAEAVLIPESEMSPDDFADDIRAGYERGKAHAIVVVAEGCTYNAQRLASHFFYHRVRPGFDLRLTILGDVQRGGAPGAFDAQPAPDRVEKSLYETVDHVFASYPVKSESSKCFLGRPSPSRASNTADELSDFLVGRACEHPDRWHETC